MAVRGGLRLQPVGGLFPPSLSLGPLSIDHFRRNQPGRRSLPPLQQPSLEHHRAPAPLHQAGGEPLAAQLDLDGRAVREAAEREKQAAAVRTQESRQEMVEHLKRRGDEETAMAVATGAWSDPLSPEQDLVKQEMIPKNKVIVHG